MIKSAAVASSVIGAASDSSIERRAGELAREMRRRWHAGERAGAEVFIERLPDRDDEAARVLGAVDLVYEEFCLRLADSASDGSESPDCADMERDLLRRFPRWASQLRVMFDCHHRLLGVEGAQPILPEVGDRIGGFRVVADIARGAHGRVYLATQSDLSNRFVVLKITPLDGREHLSLARLQHANIVPLYSMFEEPGRGLRVLCMPYFGRATLASLLARLSAKPVESRAGRDLIAFLDDDTDAGQAGESSGIAGMRSLLADLSYVQAVCCIVACVADGLHFAHERGLAHFDLKPSNILLATDGQPMLLDFHLAREPIRALDRARGDAPVAPDHLGGTPPYMAPEQDAAMRALQEGRPIEIDVDRRADIHALGVILYESLSGRLPEARGAVPPAKLNAHVSVGLSDIVARCLSDQPDRRYADADRLADDLRRHVTDRPLRGVRNRSVVERWRKWRRRRPGRLRVAVAAVIVIGFAVGAGMIVARDRYNRHELARAALVDAERLLADDRADEAVSALERGLSIASGGWFEEELRHRITEQLARARRADLARRLHRIADEVRILYVADPVIPREQRDQLTRQCSELWQRRDALLAATGHPGETQVGADLQDIAIFSARLQSDPSASPEPAQSESAQSESAARRHLNAMTILNEAIAQFGPSAVLEHERRLQQRAAPGSGVGPESAIEAARPLTPPRSAWEHCALGRAYLISGDPARSVEHLSAAIGIDPADSWSNFYYGVAQHRLGRHREAIAAFSVCIGAAPDIAIYYSHRAIAWESCGLPERAIADDDQVLRLDPANGQAALHRGVTRLRLGDHQHALDDLTLALTLGADPAAAHRGLAQAHAAMGNPARADEHFRLMARYTAVQSPR